MSFKIFLLLFLCCTYNHLYLSDSVSQPTSMSSQAPANEFLQRYEHLLPVEKELVATLYTMMTNCFVDQQLSYSRNFKQRMIFIVDAILLKNKQDMRSNDVLQAKNDALRIFVAQKSKVLLSRSRKKLNETSSDQDWIDALYDCLTFGLEATDLDVVMDRYQGCPEIQRQWMCNLLEIVKRHFADNNLSYKNSELIRQRLVTVFNDIQRIAYDRGTKDQRLIQMNNALRQYIIVGKIQLQTSDNKVIDENSSIPEWCDALSYCIENNFAVHEFDEVSVCCARLGLHNIHQLPAVLSVVRKHCLQNNIRLQDAAEFQQKIVRVCCNLVIGNEPMMPSAALDHLTSKDVVLRQRPNPNGPIVGEKSSDEEWCDALKLHFIITDQTDTIKTGLFQVDDYFTVNS